MNVVDTSVVMKWLFRENNSDKALSLLEREKEFLAPDFIRMEAFSNLTKKVRRGVIDIKYSRLKQQQFEVLTLNMIKYSHLEALAFETAISYPITFYDAIFVATAIKEGAKLYTYDLRLIRSLSNSALEEFVCVPD